jgi:hypothetical protein
MSRVVGASDRFSLVRFEQYEDWANHPRSVYSCPSCATEVGVTMSDLERHVGSLHSNLSQSEQVQSREALRGEGAHYLDFRCPGCSAPVATSYEVGLGMKSGGYQLLQVWEGRPAAPEEEVDGLRAILSIGHDTSLRGAGLSLRDALARSGYGRVRETFEAKDLVPLMRAEPELVLQWLMYSQDKRTRGGWYLVEGSEIGRVGVPESVERFPSMEEATAEYVVRELDFWAEVGRRRT